MSNNQEEKKPIYKKWWFWLIIIIIIIIAIGGSQPQETSENETKATSSNSEETTEQKKEVIVADFSKMKKEEIEDWCKTNNVKYDITEEFSDTVKKGKFVSQSVDAESTIYEGDEIKIIYSLGKEPTMGEKNALEEAINYLSVMPFSYEGLIDQLEYEKKKKKEATYGADNCGADWNEQAKKMAEQYINTMSFSKSGLIDQLEYEGFTTKQAEYGVSAIGY